MMASWNHNVHLWLKHYVQNRIVAPVERPQLWQTITTFTVSAFWHGFYPLYYFTFFMCAIFVELSKDVYRSRILFEWVPFPNITANLIVMFIINYLGTSFAQLTFDRGFNFGQGTNYFVFIMLPLLFAVSKGIKMTCIAKKKQLYRD